MAPASRSVVVDPQPMSTASTMATNSESAVTVSRAQALDRAGGNQPSLRLGDPTGERRKREHHEPEHEHAPAPEQVRHPPPQQQEPAERERVRVDDPGQVSPREKCRWAPIDGSATLTIDASITITNCVIAEQHEARDSSRLATVQRWRLLWTGLSDVIRKLTSGSGLRPPL